MGSRGNATNKNGSLADLASRSDVVLAFEGELKRQLQPKLSASYSWLQPCFEDWRTFHAMYKGTYKPPKAKGPFADLHVALSAKTVNRNVAHRRASMVPDPSTMRCFAAMPAASVSEAPPLDNYDQLSRCVEASIQHDLIRCKYEDRVNKINAINLELTGNAYEISHWRMENKPVPMREQNPLYDPMIMPEELEFTNHFRVMGMNGEPLIVHKDPETEVETTVQEWTEVFKTVREYDAPWVDAISPFNVFPAELDRDGIENCSGVFIRDICNLWDLKADQVRLDEMGEPIGNYIGLDNVPGDSYTPAVEDGPMNDDSSAWMENGQSKAVRITYWGVVNWDEACYNLGWAKFGPEMLQVLEEFNANENRARHLKVWTAEFLGGQGAGTLGSLCRFQPNPSNFEHDGRAQDSIPVVQYRANIIPDCTIGFPDMLRTELPERIYNHYLRMMLEQMQNVSNPPAYYFKELIDGKWDQMRGGTWSGLEPGLLIPALQPGLKQAPIVPIELPTEGIQHCQQAMVTMSSAMETQSNPGVVAGNLTSGSTTAREVSLAAAGVDIVDQMKTRDSGFAFVRTLEKIRSLHKQYDWKKKVVQVPGEDGKWEQFNVDAATFERGCIFFATGPKTMADREVALEAFQMILSQMKESGRLNWEVAIQKLGSFLNLHGLAEIIGPEPPAEKPAARLAGSIAGDATKMHPDIAMACWKTVGVELPENAAALQAQTNAQLQAVESARQGQAPQMPGDENEMPDLAGAPEALSAAGTTDTGLLDMTGTLHPDEQMGAY